MRLTFLFLLLFLSSEYYAQKDSLYNKTNSIQYYFAPSILIGSGLYINTTKYNWSKQNLQQSILSKHTANTNIDNYLPYVPIAQMYAGKMMGLKSRSSYFNQTKNLFFSQLFTAIITHGLKQTTNVTRPNGANYSFPSGHTSSAFSSASTLFYEYKDSNLAYASSGFIVSGTTGALRVLKNKHWVSDVSVGAGIAILVTHLVYHFEPLKNWNPLKSRKERLKKRSYTFVW